MLRGIIAIAALSLWGALSAPSFIACKTYTDRAFGCREVCVRAERLKCFVIAAIPPTAAGQLYIFWPELVR